MPDYKVKITPELDSGKFQKEIKNLTKDRTMKIKIDTSGLEKAAKLTEKLSKTPVNWNFPNSHIKIPDIISDADIKRINDTQQAYERLWLSTKKLTQPSSAKTSFTQSLSGISNTTDAIKEMIQTLDTLQQTSKIAQQTTSASTGNSNPVNHLKSVLDGGISVLNTILKASSTYENISVLSDKAKRNLD